MRDLFDCFEAPPEDIGSVPAYVPRPERVAMSPVPMVPVLPVTTAVEDAPEPRAVDERAASPAAFALFGHDLLGDAAIDPSVATTAVLSRRFVFPPFTVLDARSGLWQDRKRAWLSIGIKSEIGRDARAFNIGLDASPENGWQLADDAGSGTSIFDPVLCELSYRWFCPPGGHILDPFAGGSVRGIVASKLGFVYVGVDLSRRQIDANIEQGMKLCAGGAAEPLPDWIHGDSTGLATFITDNWADMVFSCPPYGDLERYSDDPHDLSAMSHEAFLVAYRAVIAGAVSRLKPNRFAVFVVGDFRDAKGFYRRFPEDTVAAFEAAGLRKYNEVVLVTTVGSLAVRTGKQFETSRKMGKTHQNVLVFCKGDPRAAAAACRG